MSGELFGGGHMLAGIVLIIGVAWFGGWLAHRVAGGGSRDTIAKANAVAGGFLLGAGLLHFLPDAHAHFELVYPNHAFPIAFAICAGGFAAILAIERILFDPEKHAVEQKGKADSAAILAVALGVHSILAGFAVGAERDALAGLVLVAALAVHKFAASFTLGSSLMRGGISAPAYRKIIIAFSVSTPIGIILGTVARGFMADHTGALFEATFDALAAGTFIYIAALDVIHDEFFHKRAHWIDLMLFVGGLVVMGILAHLV